MATEDATKRMDAPGSVVEAADLYLFVYDRPLHPELFRHYADYRVVQGRYHADIWLVGLSHVVTVTCGNRSMTELLCRDSEVLPTRGVISRFRLKGERDQERRTPDKWCHMVSTQVETMEDSLYRSVHNDLRRHAMRGGWFVAFDQWADGDLVPFTYMDQEARDSEFHVHAFHAFPAERTIIKVQSIFELPPS